MAGAGVFPKVTGDVIYHDDYNAIRTVINSVLETYYFQTGGTAATATGQSIDDNEWDLLKTDIDKCYTHITGSNSSAPAVNAGDLVTYSNTNAYNTAAAYCSTNKATVYASTQLALVSGLATTNRNGASSPWHTGITSTVSATFASVNDIDAFFNLGGYFTMGTTSSGGGGYGKDLNWSTMITNAGTRNFTRAIWVGLKSVGVGDTSDIYTNSGSSVYSANSLTYRVEYYSSTVLRFHTILTDAAGPNPNYDENVTLNISSSLGQYKSVDAIVSPLPSSYSTVANFTGS